MKYVQEFFCLRDDYCEQLQGMMAQFGYDGFGELVFFRTYSRLKSNGKQENWADVVIRVINGTLSIRKDWYKKNFIEWDEERWQRFAFAMSVSMFKMYWLPAGRGLWAMGTEFVYERGSMALQNCGFCVLGGSDRLSDDFYWMMDALMLGVGVGFEPTHEPIITYSPVGEFIHYTDDSREGWCTDVKLLIDAYTKPNRRKPIFKHDNVRKRGELIKGFGGKASGPEPLITLLEYIEKLLSGPPMDPIRLKTDIANMIGVCVVAGNVRRSAELCKGRVWDDIFMDLKNYKKHPEREAWGWMSNNAAALEEDGDFLQIGEIAKRIPVRGEPGVMNMQNMPFGRIGRPIPVRRDKARGLNPCGETPLEDRELCNVDETCPTMCPTIEDWHEACDYATFYASTVSLLPTHHADTNAVVMRNRRILVSIIDWTGWIEATGLHKVIRHMREGYCIVTEKNQHYNAEAGVPESIRKTGIKPGGTGPKLPGKTPGIGYPTFRETLRRIRVASNNPICPVLDEAGVPWEPCFYDPSGTRIYEYPTVQGPAPPAEEVSLWQQAMNLVTVQREWSDNSVSNTLYFKPKWKLVWSRNTVCRSEEYIKTDRNRQFFELAEEFYEVCGLPGLREKLRSPMAIEFEYTERVKVKIELNKFGDWEFNVWKYDPNHEEGIIEKVLSSIMPLIKSCSLLPHTAKGAYRQMPEEGISREEYLERKAKIKPINWDKFCGSDGVDERYCQGDACELPQR